LSIGAILGAVCLLLGGIAVLVWRISTRHSRIWFKTLDEVAVVKELMHWARTKVSGPIGHRLWAGSMMIDADSIPAIQSISRGELAILAPFIDEWIEGKLPPQNLPAEYEDYRPRVLLAFKQRLQSEGRWPYSRIRFTASERRT